MLYHPSPYNSQTTHILGVLTIFGQNDREHMEKQLRKGGLIGKKGEAIARIRQATGSAIKIDPGSWNMLGNQL